MHYFIPNAPYRNIFYQNYLITIFRDELKWTPVSSRDDAECIASNKLFSIIDELSFVKNEIELFWQICHKTNMAFVLKNTSVIPKTLVIKDIKIIGECGNDTLESDENIWYLKKNNSGRGKDIYILDEFGKYKTILNNYKQNIQKKINCTTSIRARNTLTYHLNDTWILQKAINPLLLHQCKFTIRHFFMIQRQDNTLFSYLYDDFYIIKNNNKYDRESNNTKSHITHGFRKECVVINPRKWEHKEHYLQKSLTASRQIAPNLLNKFKAQGANCYQLFGFDTMLDANFNFCLIEINYGPGFSPVNQFQNQLFKRIIKDLIHLVILPEFDIKCSYQTGWQKVCQI